MRVCKQVRCLLLWAVAVLAALAVLLPTVRVARAEENVTAQDAVAQAQSYIERADEYTQASIWRLRAAVEQAQANGNEETTAEVLRSIQKLKTKRTTTAQGFDENNVVLRFGALSDIHLWVNGGDEKFATALEMLNEQAGANPLDAVLFAGDMTDKLHAASNSDEIKEFKRVLEGKVDVSETAVLYALGNHDSFRDNTSTTTFVKMFSDVFRENTDFTNRYFAHDTDKTSIAYGNRHMEYKGYHFLAVQVEMGYTTSQQTLDWLDGELSAIVAENPDRYIFLVTHCAPEDTVYGTQACYAGVTNNNIDSVLCKYPQVVCMSGHFHNDTNLATSVMQKDYTCIELGSVNYAAATIFFNGMRTPYGGDMMPVTDYSQFSYFEIDANGNVRMKRLNGFSHSVLETKDFLAPDADGYFLEEYTPYRYYGNTPLYFAETAKIEFHRTDARKGTLAFSRASGDDLLFYEVTCTEKGSTQNLFTGNWTDNLFYYGKANLPDTVSGTLRSIPFAEGKTYVMTVTPCDEWGRKGTPISLEWEYTGSTDASAATVVLSQNKYTFESGKTYCPSVTVTFDGKTLTEGVDYLLAYSNNDRVGTATVRVNFMDAYSGSVRKTYTIEEAPSTKPDDENPDRPPKGDDTPKGGCNGAVGGSSVLVGVALLSGVMLLIYIRKMKERKGE